MQWLLGRDKLLHFDDVFHTLRYRDGPRVQLRPTAGRLLAALVRCHRGVSKSDAKSLLKLNGTRWDVHAREIRASVDRAVEQYCETGRLVPEKLFEYDKKSGRYYLLIAPQSEELNVLHAMLRQLSNVPSDPVVKMVEQLRDLLCVEPPREEHPRSRDVLQSRSLTVGGAVLTAALVAGGSWWLGAGTSRVAICPDSRGSAFAGPEKEPRAGGSTASVPTTTSGHIGSKHEDWEELQGTIGASPVHGSGWIDLKEPRDFANGTRLRLQVGGSATSVVIRLLAEGESADDAIGVVKECKVPASKICETQLRTDRHRIRQISVHGGRAWAWGSPENGVATLGRVEVAFP